MLRIQTVYITEVQWNGRLGSLKHSEGKRSIHMTCTSVISMNGLASFDFIPVVHIFFWEVCEAVFPPSLLIYPEMWFKPWVSPTSLAAAIPGTKTCTSKICSFTVPWHCLAAETLVFHADTPIHSPIHLQWYHAQHCSHCTIASSPLHGFLHRKVAHWLYNSQNEESTFVFVIFQTMNISNYLYLAMRYTWDMFDQELNC